MKRCLPILAAIAFLGAVTSAAEAQTPQATRTPEASAAPSPQASTETGSPETGGFDASKLTPEQQQALQLAIIKISQNPVGNITVFPFQNNFNYGYGPYTRLQYNLNVQPVFPIMLSQTWNLVARTIIPLLNQPSSAPPTVCASQCGCPSTLGLSDVQEQLFFGPKTKPGELIWAAGPIFQFPSATPNTLGSGKWSAGPNVVALVMPGKWVLGALTSQLWSVAGPSARSHVSSFLVQPFVNYNLKGGWALTTAPIITANWTATQNKWAVPVGGGISKTLKDEGQLMQVSVQYYTWIARPLASPQTDLKITWSLLWPVKRGIDVQQLLEEAK
jgi:hypothetical protein